MKEDFRAGEDRKPEDNPEGYEMPGLQEVPWPAPGQEKAPDISPSERQHIIDDMEKEDIADEERQRRIDEIIRKRDLQ